MNVHILSAIYLSIRLSNMHIVCATSMQNIQSVFTQCVCTHVLNDAHHCNISTVDTPFVISLMVDLSTCIICRLGPRLLCQQSQRVLYHFICSTTYMYSFLPQKIRTVELDQKTIKLQIVSTRLLLTHSSISAYDMHVHTCT